MMSSRPRKKARLEFGAPTADDSPSGVARDSSSALSTRRTRHTTVPSLTSICSRLFADNYVRFRNNPPAWDRISPHLAALPELLRPRLLADLIRICGTYLTHEFLAAYFFCGPTLVLTDDLPGVKAHTVRAVERISGLRELEISGFHKIPDAAFGTALAKLPALRRLVLRGCALAGQKSLAAVAKSCRQLQVLNLNYTAATPQALQPVLLANPNLEVLKLAGLQNWTDASFAKLLTHPLTLPHLRTLKLSRLSISETSLNALLPLCPALRRLDISFTAVRHALAGPVPALEKLSLTSTPTSNADLLALLPRLPGLRTLSLGALGASQRSIAAIDAGMTLTDAALLAILPALQNMTDLESVSLVGNIKLGGASIGPFVDSVGRSCKWLNLSALPALRAHHLAALVGTPAAKLETLLLNGTPVDDVAAPFLAACPFLTWLEVGETKMTSEGLFAVLDGCPRLERLGLKSCRGVRVGERRRFFEAWEEDRAGR